MQTVNTLRLYTKTTKQFDLSKTTDMILVISVEKSLLKNIVF